MAATSKETRISGGELANRERSRRAGKVVQIVAIIAFSIFILLPLLFMVTTSIKQPIEIRESGALLPTRGIYFINWVNAFITEPLGCFYGIPQSLL